MKFEDYLPLNACHSFGALQKLNLEALIAASRLKIMVISFSITIHPHNLNNLWHKGLLKD
jgi:hypothetical protein